MLESNYGFVRSLFGEQFSNVVSDIQGFVARDTHRKEIVVAIRGRLWNLFPPRVLEG